MAALLVLVFHTGRDVGPLSVLKPIAAFGWSGVGLFLVLSGFSIHFRWAASDVPHHRFTRRGFARRRFFRLYPTYLAVVALTVALTAALGTSLTAPVPMVVAHGNIPGWLAIIEQILVFPGTLYTLPFVAVAWSLGLEIQIYAVYALLITRLRRIGVVRIVLAALGIALVWRVAAELVTTSVPVGQFLPGDHVTPLSRVFYGQVPSRAFEWFLGVLAAEAYFGRVKLPRITRSPLLAVALLAVAALMFRFPVGLATLSGHMFHISDVLLDPLVGLGYFVVLQAMIDREGWLLERATMRTLVRGLASVGLFSYSLYLLHPILLSVGERLIHDAGGGGMGETVLVWAFVLALAAVFSRVIERPWITGAGDRWVADVIARRRAGRRPEPPSDLEPPGRPSAA
ncbi:MAG: acyltransferase [Solirubrobacterales bacterium]|nr:acyltransferase [Solirubrobacterales bacterium]